MGNLIIDLLAHRVRPHVSFGDDGKPVVRLSKLAPADRTAIFEHADALRRRLAPWLYYNNRLITDAEIDECLRDSGLHDDYISGQLSKRRALLMTRSWLQQSDELHNLSQGALR